MEKKKPTPEEIEQLERELNAKPDTNVRKAVNPKRIYDR